MQVEALGEGPVGGCFGQRVEGEREREVEVEIHVYVCINLYRCMDV